MVFEKGLFDIKKNPALVNKIEGLEALQDNLPLLQRSSHEVFDDIMEKLADHCELNDSKLRTLMMIPSGGKLPGKRKFLDLEKISERIHELKQEDPRIRDKLLLLKHSFSPIVFHVSVRYHHPREHNLSEARHIIAGTLIEFRKILEKTVPG